MKRSIIIEILLIFVLGVLLSVTILNLQSIISSINWYKNNAEFYSWEEYAKETNFAAYIIRLVFYLLATIANLGAIILIAVKDFPVFNPVVDKHTARKAERTAAKKQAKITELEAQLEELRK